MLFQLHRGFRQSEHTSKVVMLTGAQPKRERVPTT